VYDEDLEEGKMRGANQKIWSVDEDMYDRMKI